MFILYEIWWYGVVNWLVFITIAFCATRFLGCFGVLLSVFVIAVILMALDVNWIFDYMRDHPDGEKDADGVFVIGVLMRVVVFNTLLLPVSYLGYRLFQRRRAKLAESVI